MHLILSQTCWILTWGWDVLCVDELIIIARWWMVVEWSCAAQLFVMVSAERLFQWLRSERLELLFPEVPLIHINLHSCSHCSRSIHFERWRRNGSNQALTSDALASVDPPSALKLHSVQCCFSHLMKLMFFIITDIYTCIHHFKVKGIVHPKMKTLTSSNHP